MEINLKIEMDGEKVNKLVQIETMTKKGVESFLRAVPEITDDKYVF